MQVRLFLLGKTEEGDCPSKSSLFCACVDRLRIAIAVDNIIIYCTVNPYENITSESSVTFSATIRTET